MSEDSGGDNDSESGEDFEEKLVDVPFVNYNSRPDEEREHARDNISKYVQLKKSIYDNVDGSDNENGEGDRPIDNGEKDAGTIVAPSVIEDGKVHGYESDYIDSLDPES